MEMGDIINDNFRNEGRIFTKYIKNLTEFTLYKMEENFNFSLTEFNRE
jgi:hypothetical protein